MFNRNIISNLLEAIEDSPVVLLNGARQTGKSTLVQAVVEKQHLSQYLTLDDPTVLSSALSDPTGFISGLNTPVVLDEVQRAPELFLPIKAAVDRNRKPGQFLLTGSANVLLLPRLSETLAGRMEILTLYPLSIGELNSSKEGFINAVFAQEFTNFKTQGLKFDLNQFINALQLGGYPEIHKRFSQKKRNNWFKNYLDTILLRDVKDIARIEGIKHFPKLINVLALRAGGLLNNSDISRITSIPNTTLVRYLTLLEAMFLVYLLQPWFTNKSKSIVKTSKVYLSDTGLLAYLRNSNTDLLSERNTMELGTLVENFVVMEILKQISWNDLRINLYYFRTHVGKEVDLVLEAAGGQIVGIEVKAKTSVSDKDFRGLKALKEMAQPKFHRGIVLYLGTHVVPFGVNLFAVPIHYLWTFGVKSIKEHIFEVSKN